MMKPARIYLVHLVFGLLPATRCFGIKRGLLRWAGAKIAEHVQIVSSARFFIEGQLNIGAGAWIGHDVLIVGGAADVTIGANVSIAPRVSIIAGSHELFGISGQAAGKGYSKPIYIMDGAWVGAGATILGGVVVGLSGMVAAGAVANRDVPAGIVVGGVPAKCIGTNKRHCRDA